MSVSSTNLSGNNVTAFNRYRRLAAEKAKAEAETISAPEPNVRMTKSQLLVIAAERGVEVSDEMTKAQIVEAINFHNAALADTPAEPKGPFDEVGE